MPKREAKLYWIKRHDKKDLLIFDAGHSNGTLYIYESKDSVIINEDEIQKIGNIQSWIEKKFGAVSTSIWKLDQSF